MSADNLVKFVGPRLRSLGARGVFAAVLVAWALVVAFGFWKLWAYTGASGKEEPPAQNWPKYAAVSLDPKGFTLVLALHPQCPCSRATVEQLDWILARCPNRLTVYAMYLKPDSMPESWVRTDIWERTKRMRHVTNVLDSKGSQARLFGAATSGDVFVFDPSGTLLFRGGITRARGHAGDSAGRDAIVGLVSGKKPVTDRAPVFGCPLFAEQGLARQTAGDGGS